MQVGADLKLWMQAMVMASCGEELALAKSVVRLRQRTMRVLWLGRSRSRAVHSLIRGVSAYTSSEGLASCPRNDAAGEPLITTAVALLGVLAGLASWFGTSVVQIRAVDDGTCKLLHYFHSLGFSPCSNDPESLAAPCYTLRKRCCPCDWVDKLPPEGELSMFSGVISERQK